MTWDTSVSVPGIRVIKPSWLRCVAGSACYSLASATTYRGVGECCKVAIKDSARSWTIVVSEA